MQCMHLLHRANVSRRAIRPFAVYKKFALCGVQKVRLVKKALDVPEQCCGLSLPALTDRGSASCSNSCPPPPCPAFASAWRMTTRPASTWRATARRNPFFSTPLTFQPSTTAIPFGDHQLQCSAGAEPQFGCATRRAGNDTLPAVFGPAGMFYNSDSGLSPTTYGAYVPSLEVRLRRIRCERRPSEP